MAEARQTWLQSAAEYTSTAAQVYLAGVFTVNEGADFVDNMQDLVGNRNPFALAGLLPIVSNGMVKLVEKKTNKVVAEMTTQQALKVSDPSKARNFLKQLSEESGQLSKNGDNLPVNIHAPLAGETASTATGKSVHKAIADARRASSEFDLVQSPITDKAGNPILVSKRVDLKTGMPQPGSPLQEAVPDAVSFQRKLILDDKPLGRPIAKDRQEIIRFIKAYQQREGQLPGVIGITRYDPQTGRQILTELYSPSDFLP